MPRSNTPGSNDRWSRLSASAQFRASINGDCSWGNDRPSPDLITCSRISPGGRMLLAFEIAEVRDYFVDGHLDQGAQSEPDGADRALARRSTLDPWGPDPQVAENSFDLAAAAYSLAAEQHRAAEAQIDAYVLPRIAQFKADGEVKAAVALRNALPMSCFTKTAALQDLMPVAPELIQRTEPASLDAELAAILLAWQRAHRRERPLSDALTQIATDLGQKLLDEGRKDELPAFAATVPSSWARAMLMDMARYGSPRSGDEAPTP